MKYAIRPATMARPAKPPTTPPAMGPALDLWETAPAVVVWVGLGVTVTKEVGGGADWDVRVGAAALAVVDVEKVDCTGGLDSGAETSARAAVTLNEPVMLTER